jgi:DNA-directed RNA polymerase I subunit RPA43
MQVTNQMLSLTGSLLDDPSNPPPPPEIQSIRAPSPTLSEMDVEDVEDEPAPPPKKHKQTNGHDKHHKANGHTPAAAQVAVVAPEVAPAVVEPEIDERFLSARELKKKHKEDAKKKRDERKSRKEDKQIEELQVAGGDLKRKAEDVAGENKKRRQA